MESSYPPLTSRIYNVLLIGGIILFLSCQSDPIVLNPPGGYVYISKTFQLDTENSHSFQGNAHTGHSPRLYAGILSNRDTVYTVSSLIKLLPDVLDSHQICSADSISKVNISLSSITQLAEEDTNLLIQKDAIQIHLISLNEIWDEDAVFDSTRLSIITTAIDTTPNLSTSLIEINNRSIDIQLFDYDSDIIQHWCETREELGIIVSYIPTDSSYLEFYSSNGSEVELGPRLALEYSIKEETSKNHTRYLINEVFWEDEQMRENMNGPYFVDDSLSGYWGTIYAMSLDENNKIIESPPLDFNSNVIQADIISAGQNVPLITIDLDLNTNILDSISSITFSILNAFAFVNEIDPAGDNWDEATSPDSTENNDTYDDGELFYDYGLDKCPDEMEKGNGECADFEEESAFNSIGTEGNKERNWTDYDGDGEWDLNEGEMWGDWGFDWCPDSLEDGSGGCLMEPSDNLGYDPNRDNIDPVGDDWHEINNPDGTEDNQQWDPGEPFYDWGSDGLPESLMGYIDEMEGNDTFDAGEPFDDTGSDGLYNINELGYNTNRTEGNGKFDGEGEFNDCGEDNCCNEEEDCDDVIDDDYNIDPNVDNWNAIDSTGTEGNGLLDDGEEWFDWGLDGIQDSLEAFQASSVIPIELYDNSYIIDLDEEIPQVTPGLEMDTVSLWISEIQKIDSSLIIEVSVQSNQALKGLQFQLYHTPYTKVDTTLETYTRSIAQIGEGKLFEDFTLLPRYEYDPLMLDTTLQINYANDVAAFLNFDSLNLFLENEEYIFSPQYSNLVFYIDSTKTDIHKNGMIIYITHSDNSVEEQILSPPIAVTSSSDSVKIPMGLILRAYQSGSIGSYNGLQLKADDNLYNYSKLSIKNDLRIDVMYSQ